MLSFDARSTRAAAETGSASRGLPGPVCHQTSGGRQSEHLWHREENRQSAQSRDAADVHERNGRSVLHDVAISVAHGAHGRRPLLQSYSVVEAVSRVPRKVEFSEDFKNA
jgi:hypothetical protein